VKIVQEKDISIKNLNKDPVQRNVYSKIRANSTFSTKSFTTLDEIDRRLLQLVQNDFPILENPWKKISCLLELNEDEVLIRIRRLYNKGIIRKIGAVVDPPKMGLSASTLIAIQIPQNKVKAVSKIINSYPNVTHNYERDNEYNIWFTLSAQNMELLEGTLADIINKSGCKASNVLNLPTIQRFKVNVIFQLL